MLEGEGEGTGMSTLKEPERITLAEALKLLEAHVSTEEAKARLGQAFVRRALRHAPAFTFPYDGAVIDWASGFVKLPRKRDPFCPTFSRTEFNAYFFDDESLPAGKSVGMADAGISDEAGKTRLDDESRHYWQALAERGGALECDHRKVFIVHGREEGPREAVARFLERLGFQPIILHEQANQGMTVIEKVEANSDVGFAVIILTPDDVGGLKGEPLQPRARQNVLLELGYFIGKLTRRRVCTLKVGEMEIPSDWCGVVDEPYDAGGGWKQTLARELKAAEYEIDWNKVMSP
jgi:predicted nucleotide-binding protein